MIVLFWIFAGTVSRAEPGQVIDSQVTATFWEAHETELLIDTDIQHAHFGIKERHRPKVRISVNSFDIVMAGVDIGIILLFWLLIIPSMRTVAKEKKRYKELLKQKQAEEMEMRSYDFH
jgi:hypothetical protein